MPAGKANAQEYGSPRPKNFELCRVTPALTPIYGPAQLQTTAAAAGGALTGRSAADAAELKASVETVASNFAFMDVPHTAQTLDAQDSIAQRNTSGAPRCGILTTVKKFRLAASGLGQQPQKLVALDSSHS